MKPVVCIVFLFAVTACSRIGASSAVPEANARDVQPFNLGNGKIQHVIVIVQENRTVDNLFNGFPGADTVQSGKNSYGTTVPLQPVSLAAPYDIGHDHGNWLNEYNDGKMNGFNLDSEKCYAKKSGGCPHHTIAAYGYVPKDEVKQYWTLAQSYVFADNTFETNQGPSFPAHQYLVSGSSSINNDIWNRAADNASAENLRHQGGCDSGVRATVPVININGNLVKPVFPCFERRSIMTRMNEMNVTWRYYQARPGHGAWNALDALRGIRYGTSYKNVIWPSHTFIRDVAKGRLAQVTYVTPTANNSDHPAHNNGTGPAWVASVVNAVGESPYWDITAIFITWDDWGGWYDHVAPHIYNAYELGFRVPLIVVSPYAKSGYVSHQAHEFGSILKFVEGVFNLKSLDTTDVRSDDFSDCFDFSQAPRKFKRIPGALGKGYFTNQSDSADEPEED